MTDPKISLSRYVESVKQLPEVLDSGETFSLSDGSRKNYSVCPLSLAQLSSMLPGGKAALSGIFPEMGSKLNAGIELCDPASMKIASGPKDTIPDEMTREDLIKLTVYSIAEKICDAGNVAARVDDVIFQLKNGAGIPDDFMPQCMMEVVEGRSLSDPAALLSDLQPSFSSGVIFPLFRIAWNDVLSVGFLSCYRDAFLNPQRIGGVDLVQAVRNEFISFTQDPAYNEFVAGRTLRSVVYSMEKKKSRVIGRPLFDAYKIQALMKIGLISEVGGVYTVQDRYTLLDVKKLASDYEARNHLIASEWKQKKIRLSN